MGISCYINFKTGYASDNWVTWASHANDIWVLGSYANANWVFPPQMQLTPVLSISFSFPDFPPPSLTSFLLLPFSLISLFYASLSTISLSLFLYLSPSPPSQIKSIADKQRKEQSIVDWMDEWRESDMEFRRRIRCRLRRWRRCKVREGDNVIRICGPGNKNGKNNHSSGEMVILYF